MKHLLAVALWFLSLQVLAAEYYGDLVVEKYISAYDGDTFRVDIAEIHPLIGRNMPIRLRGVDTPEMRGRCDQENQDRKWHLPSDRTGSDRHGERSCYS